MPIGPPSHRPAPKSAFRWVAIPMLATNAPLLAWAGSRDTSACHTFVAGRSGQPRRAVPDGGGGCAADGEGLGEPVGDADGSAGAVPPVSATFTHRACGAAPWAGEQATAAKPTTSSTVARRHRRRSRSGTAVAYPLW